MPSPVDLSDIPVVDNHCHAIESRHPTDVIGWRRLFTESPDPAMHARHAADTAFYHRLIRAMAAFHGVECTEDGVLQARGRHTVAGLTAALFRDASIATLVVDTGYPEPSAAMSESDVRAASGAPSLALLRLELMFQELIPRSGSYGELLDSTHERLANVRASGFAGLKSIAGYRTGLGIRRWPDDEVRASYRLASQEAAATGSVRLGHQPLLDTLLHASFAAAAAQELPVQFHVGYGDPDVDLRKASPLELRAVLEDPGYRRMPVVLLHGCWPYVREGAYLASVYANVYLDVSYAIPFLSTAEMLAMTRAAFAVAPFGKLMYSSDGARVPELHWIGAHAGRKAIGAVLGELVSDGDLDVTEAHRVGGKVLAGTARGLYRLGTAEHT